MSSSRPDTHPSPYDGAGDPLIPEPEKSPRSPTPPIPFDSWEQFWSNMISLSWRCLTTAFALLLLIIGLWGFSRMGKLSHMQQRWFNTITILLGASASLGLGSMLGYLGTMLRWRLLARKKYKMQDIELLLAMPTPTGSAELLFAHFREWRLSLTTFIVMLYLFMNITGRLSVAIFGLTYNLKDNSTSIYPTLTTDWTYSGLVGKNTLDFEVEKNSRSYLDLVRGGLTEFGHVPEIKFDISVPQDLTDGTLDGLRLDTSKPEENRGNVSFTYYILDFEGAQRDQKPSDHAVHSSATCTMFRLDGHKYWKDYDSEDQTPKDWEDKGNGETIAEVLRVLESQKSWPGQGTEQVTWAAPLPKAEKLDPFSVTYVVYNDTAWECTSSLFETQLGNPLPKPLFNSGSLFLLPIAQREAQQGAPGSGGHLDSSWGSPSLGGTSSIVYRSFMDLQTRSSPSVGVQTLNFYQNGTGGSATQKRYYNLYVAALIARLPIAAIAYGNSDRIFPQRIKDPKAHLAEHVETTLEVKWGRVGIAAGAIVLSQILAITAVVCYCRNVYVREDSYLTTAELLKSVLNEIGDGNAMTAKELGESLDKALGGPVSYGTILGSLGDQPKMVLGREVDYNFPGFPPPRKRSVFRR
ncbi:hypothetical protein B9Z19DRAFT_1131900 [Tuber borchii]|uniref:Uncharacterized protein n=1 Tax=Tuber borchii TaxID=42251 RepID=A0A2T6ZHZ8_TUBBO|nr:hypothetical protein B9Z19DRAFT_1131900 [Tuber borchii]